MTSSDHASDPVSRRRPSQLRHRFDDALAARISPEQTRSATRLEGLTVRRLSWQQVVRVHRYLELGGKLTTGLWVAFLGSAALGVDWKGVAESAVNSGEPVRGALVLAILVPTLVFVAARSVIGFARWRLQRELWRRDVERLGGPDANHVA